MLIFIYEFLEYLDLSNQMYTDRPYFLQGDRMWMYAISIFLIALTPGSFLFTAIYGLAVSLSVVAFGTLVGDWIDITPRLKGILYCNKRFQTQLHMFNCLFEVELHSCFCPSPG